MYAIDYVYQGSFTCTSGGGIFVVKTIGSMQNVHKESLKSTQFKDPSAFVL